MSQKHMLLLRDMIRGKISPSIFIFGLLTMIVILSQISLLKPVIGMGFTNEDYGGLLAVRVYRDDIFSDPVSYWMKVGVHNVSHEFYIAFLDLLFGENYDNYIYTTIFFKIIATLLLYPLILLISKNKLLAFLGTFLYGISYSSTGALRLYVVGNEYLGLALMNLFLVFYFLCIKKLKFWLLLLSSCSITLSFLISPIRVFPVFAIVLLVELVILIRNRFSNFLPSLLRLFLIALPTVVIAISSMGNSGSGTYSLAGLPNFLKKVSDGNWYLLLNPLWGLGYTFLPISSQVKIFGQLNVSNFSSGSYFGFLFHGPFIISTIVSLFLSLVLSKQKMRFFFILTSINLIFDVITYFLFSHHLRIPPNLVREGGFDVFHGLYSNILANYVISISITCGIEWFLTGRKNQLFLFAFASSFLSLSLIISQWIFTRDYSTYTEGILRYFVIPAIGSYFFIASLIALIYQRIKLNHKLFTLSILIIGFLILSIYNISKREIVNIFNGTKGSGIDLGVQRMMKAQALGYISEDKIKNGKTDLIIYTKFKSSVLEDANNWENTFDWRNLVYWFYVSRSYLTKDTIDSCIISTWDFSELQKSAIVKNGSKGFLLKNGGNKEAKCFHKNIPYTLNDRFVALDNLYAFAIEGPKVINVTDEVKKGLEFKYIFEEKK